MPATDSVRLKRADWAMDRGSKLATGRYTPGGTWYAKITNL